MKLKGFILVALIGIITTSSYSQDAEVGKIKNFRFGLKVAPSVNWLKPKNTREFERAGIPLGFNFGLVTEFKLAELFSFSTGLELNYEAGKIRFIEATNQAFYYINGNYSMVETKEVAEGVYGPSDTNNIAKVSLDVRKYNNTYVTIPVGIKMKTNEIGYMTYFGEFGLNLSLRTRTRVTDTPDASGSVNPNGVDLSDLSKILYDKDMQFARAQLNIGLGAEYSLSGSTSLFGAVHYNLGFTNVVRANSKFLVDENNARVDQSFSAQGIRLTVGVLF